MSQTRSNQSYFMLLATPTARTFAITIYGIHEDRIHAWSVCAEAVCVRFSAPRVAAQVSHIQPRRNLQIALTQRRRRGISINSLSLPSHRGKQSCYLPALIDPPLTSHSFTLLLSRRVRPTCSQSYNSVIRIVSSRARAHALNLCL